MRLSVDRKFRGTMPHLYEDGWLWVSRGNRIERTHDLGQTWETVATLYTGRRALLARTRTVERFSKNGCFSLYRLDDGALLAITQSGPRMLEPGATQFRALTDHPVDFRPMRRGVLPMPGGELLVGAYRFNGGNYPTTEGRDPVEVMHYTRGTRQWVNRHHFPRATIRHVHVLARDPFVEGRLWLCTGDTDDESMIAWSDDGLSTLTPFSSGGQESRTCDLVFGEDSLLWGVDSPIRQSGIVRKKRAGGPLEWLCKTPAPVYYASSNEDGNVFFSTTIEPGPSVKSRHTEIFASLQGEAFASVYHRRADTSPQFSQTHFPRGLLPENYLVWSSIATWRDEATMMIGRLEA